MWENMRMCQVGLDECNKICVVDKAELIGKNEELQDELDSWYRNPWIIGTIGIVVGLGVGLGVGFGK
jgi:hypothetical protein